MQLALSFGFQTYKGLASPSPSGELLNLLLRLLDLAILPRTVLTYHSLFISSLGVATYRWDPSLELHDRIFGF